jgi:hypothetical protein
MEPARSVARVGGVRFVDEGLLGVGRVGFVDRTGDFGLEDICF